MSILVWRASLRQLRRHPWLVFACVLGVALGVAVVLAVDIAVYSAQNSLQGTQRTLTGGASHHLRSADPQGLDESIYTRLRRSHGPWKVAPVIELPIQTLGPSSRRLTLLGVDPWAEFEFRPQLLRGRGADSSSSSGGPSGMGPLRQLLTEANTVLLHTETAKALGLAPGERMPVDVAGHSEEVTLLASFGAREQGLRSVAVMDIGQAQSLARTPGRLTRIDLIADPSGEDFPALTQILHEHPELYLESTAERQAGLSELTRAFQVNLRAMSSLAMVVGIFLVYNTMTFLVVQRRPLHGALRAAGVSPLQLLGLTLVTAGLIAAVGVALGLGLGLLLAQSLLGLVVQSINDLYAQLQATELDTPAWRLASLAGAGWLASLAASLPAALEAARSAPRQVLSRSRLERRARARALPLFGLGLAGVGLSLLLLRFGPDQLLVGYAGLFGTILAVSVMVPACVLGYAWLLRRVPLLGQRPMWALSVGALSAQLSRTGVALSALVVAVATTLSVASMVHSFRGAVIEWLDHTLLADYYVTLSQRQRGDEQAKPAFDASVLSALSRLPGVEHVATNYTRTVSADFGAISLTALGVDERTRGAFRLTESATKDSWQAFVDCAGLYVSEPLAYHQKLAAGELLRLQGPTGSVEIPILGVFRDFASDRGRAVIHSCGYERWLGTPGLTALGLHVRAENQQGEFSQELESIIAANSQPLTLRASSALRELTLTTFDRTFAITSVLQLMTAVIAFVGVLAALMALVLERRRDTAILRAAGMTPSQCRRYVYLQTTLMGCISGLLACGLGTVLAFLLLRVINRQSFGWTIPVELSPSLYAQAFALALGAAVCAGIIPAQRLSRQAMGEGLRHE